MLTQLIQDFEALEPPRSIPRDIRERIDLEMLEEEVLRCAEAAVVMSISYGVANPDRGTLRACRTELEAILPRLTGHAAEYYRLLHRICLFAQGPKDHRDHFHG